jgi:hypothetical protein
MDNKKTLIIIITIVLTIIEGLLFYFLKLNSFFVNILGEDNPIVNFVSSAIPVGVVFFLNYYVISPLIYNLGILLTNKIGNYMFLRKYYLKVIYNCINWLISLKKHWGPLDASEECQNANTCEGLIALRKSNLHNLKHEIYREAFSDVLLNVSKKGLPSKTLLNNPTVVCTSMILYLVALEREDNSSIVHDFNEFEEIASFLWSVRGNRGWGVYLEKTCDEHCNIANTFWALRVLNKYGIGRTDEYKRFTKKIYEFAKESKFGFNTGDQPRLITTAMSISLYFQLDLNMRKSIDNSGYKIKDAIDYVFESFVKNGIQFEKHSCKT